MIKSRALQSGLRWLALIAVSALCAAPMACSIYRNDRCYIDEGRYGVLRGAFIQTGSLDLIRQQMETLQFARCQKNEVLYRLKKEFEVPVD